MSYFLQVFFFPTINWVFMLLEITGKDKEEEKGKFK